MNDRSWRRTRAQRLAAATLLLATVVVPARKPALGAPAQWRIDSARSRIVVHVHRKGALSPFLHDHDLRPERWHGTIVVDADRPDGARVEVVIDAQSLHDDQPALSPADREQVEMQVRGPDILDAARYPEIRFVADRLDLPERTGNGERTGKGEATTRGVEVTTGAGVLRGILELHGQSRALDIHVHGRALAEAISATGEVTFRPSDFGIAPYSRMLGTIAVEDRVTVEVAIEAVPAH